MTLTPENKSAWLAALRSGEYEQGAYALCREGKYCCLGVYYDVCVDSYWHPVVDSWGQILWEANDGCAALLSSCTGITFDDQKTLARMNDSGKSFDEIADWIEANL